MANVLNSKEFNIWEENETVFLVNVLIYRDCSLLQHSTRYIYSNVKKEIIRWQTDMKA